EQQPDQAVGHPRHKSASRRIGTLLPEPHDGVGALALRDEEPEVLERELAIAVGEEDPPLRSGDEAGADRPAVTAAGPVMDPPEPRVLPRQLVGDRAGAVAASIVH